MSTAVRGLREKGTYDGKIRFFVVEVSSQQVRDEVARWKGLGSHGLVGTTAAKELKVMIPGHNFGLSEVVAKADALLAAARAPPSKSAPPAAN